MFRSFFLLALASGLLAGSAASAGEGLSTRLLDQLSCRKRPDPTPILLTLTDEKKIDVTTRTGRDGVACWAFATPLVIEDMTFDHVCASSEDPLAIGAHPELYVRAPGTSPGTSIALISQAEPARLSAWLKGLRPNAGDRSVAATSDVVPGEAAISCRGFTTDEARGPAEGASSKAVEAAPDGGASTMPSKPVGTAVAVHVPPRGSRERSALGTAIHAWLKTDGLTADVILDYRKIRSDGRYAYALAAIRRPDGKPVPDADWYGAEGCENDPDPGLVEALLVDAASGWTIVRANRCADDVMITPREAEKRFGLPADFVSRR